MVGQHVPEWWVNILRNLHELGSYSQLSDERIYEKFIQNNGTIQINDNDITIELKKKRDLPQTLEMMVAHKDLKYPRMGNRKIVFYPSATS